MEYKLFYTKSVIYSFKILLCVGNRIVLDIKVVLQINLRSILYIDRKNCCFGVFFPFKSRREP